MGVLQGTELQQQVAGLDGWELSGDAIRKTYSFDGYMPGIEFVNRLALLAEERGHHPDLQVGYGEVQVRFSTHSEGGVTEKDIELAKATDGL